MPARSSQRYTDRVPHQWWGVWPLDLRRLLHLVPVELEFSIVGSEWGFAARRALCGKRLVAQRGEFVPLKDVEPHRQCGRCLRVQRAAQRRSSKALP